MALVRIHRRANAVRGGMERHSELHAVTAMYFLMLVMAFLIYLTAIGRIGVYAGFAARNDGT